jgi:hypothetical protein
MPPQRTPLGQISSDQGIRGPELTSYERGRISGLYEAGFSPREVEKQLDHSRGAVRSTITLHNRNTQGASLPRSGRPVLYNERDRRMMLRNLRLYPKMTFQQRRDETGLKMSNSYIKDLARKSGLSHWRAKEAT